MGRVRTLTPKDCLTVLEGEQRVCRPGVFSLGMKPVGHWWLGIGRCTGIAPGAENLTGRTNKPWFRNYGFADDTDEDIQGYKDYYWKMRKSRIVLPGGRV